MKRKATTRGCFQKKKTKQKSGLKQARFQAFGVEKTPDSLEAGRKGDADGAEKREKRPKRGETEIKTLIEGWKESRI